MKKAKRAILFFVNVFFLFTVLFFSVNFVQADNFLDMQAGLGNDSGEIGSVFSTSGNETDLRMLVVNVIKVLLGLLALIFTVLIIMAGFRWMNSRGNEDEVTKAKAQLKNAIIGIIIIIASYAITIFVISMTEAAINGNV